MTIEIFLIATLKIFFKKLLEIVLLDSYFIFNQELYSQIDGPATGSPVAPILANIFLSYHEQRWLRDCPSEFKPILYRRYVDDTFLVFNDKSHIDKFLQYLNNKHPNIKFTQDLEQNNRLPFLDILIEHKNNSFSTSLYRKPTFTGLGLKFNSFTPFYIKLAERSRLRPVVF